MAACGDGYDDGRAARLIAHTHHRFAFVIFT
jgi:hypothetical protein